MTAHSNKPLEEGSVVGYLALVLSWLVPGLGHLMIGQKARGLIFALTIHGLFAAGLLIGGIRAINPVDQPIWTYTQFLSGWPMLVANPVEKQLVQPPSPTEKSKFDTLMDSYIAHRPSVEDPAQTATRIEYGKKGMTELGVLSYHPKIQDIGSVYCGIAGMLNLLVMFDVLLRITGAEREKDKKNLPAAPTPIPAHESAHESAHEPSQPTGVPAQ